MAATTTTLSAILKTFYVSDQLNDQLNNQSVLYDKLFRKGAATMDATGKNYTYAIRESRNRTAGKGISEGGNFGTPDNQGTRNITVPDTQLVTGIELSGRVIKAATGANKGSFMSAFTLEVESGRDDTVRAINRQLHSDGMDALAYWTAADDTSGATVDDGQGNAFVHLESGTTTVDIIDASDNAAVLGNDIPLVLGAEAAANYAVTWASGTVSGTADGDFVILADTLGKSLMGIRGVISASDPLLPSGGLHGLAVATYPYWKAQSFGNSGTNRDLTLELMQRPLSSINTRSGMSEADVTFLMSNSQVKDKYISLLLADQRHVNTTNLKGGQTAVDFNGKPIIVDPQCRRNTLYYIAPKTMDLLSSSNGLVWADFEDGLQFKMKTGSSGYADAYQAFLVFYGALACKNRGGNAVLLDLAE
jgi:hypothetical protein